MRYDGPKMPVQEAEEAERRLAAEREKFHIKEKEVTPAVTTKEAYVAPGSMLMFGPQNCCFLT